MEVILLVIHVLIAAGIIALVLLQHGKGADMGASFGSGASGSLFGATGSANFLSRSTAVCAFVFFVATLFLAYSANDWPKAATGSVLDRLAASAPASSTAASGAAAIPGVVTVPAVAPAPARTATPSAPVGASGAAAIPQK